MPIPRIRPYSFDADTGVADNVTSWRLEPHRAVLLVHDMQSHFVSKFDRAADRPAQTASPSEPHAGQLDVAIGSIGRLALRRSGWVAIATPLGRFVAVREGGPGATTGRRRRERLARGRL